MKNAATQPGTVVRTLLRIAVAGREERFVADAVVQYFDRIMNASGRKLKSYGLRPVVAPVAAELALNRARSARTYHEFVARLIDDDEYVAQMALRAVQFYASSAQNGAAQAVRRNLAYIH
ncbi:hypothetical protein CSC67_07750 [Pusillimonas caeni]|uniref:hypothetical protein n=1 Tax=Pusillimonas caeni TaxID=1348472 RepID=UPI001074DD57|nr:hypothetical protein [Pusillimonas caeni]TFL14054.1 hypothetical protein CSC67_07750 [Pusillimonas caeni]